jgi:hypothetical protein
MSLAPKLTTASICSFVAATVFASDGTVFASNGTAVPSRFTMKPSTCLVLSLNKMTDLNPPSQSSLVS